MRRAHSYILRAAAFLFFLGTAVMLIILFDQYTGHDVSTNTNHALPVSDPIYFIPAILCNGVGLIALLVYGFVVERKYRKKREAIAPGRALNVAIAIGLCGLAAVVSFVMMGFTFQQVENRNVVAIVLLVVAGVLSLAGVGVEQWTIYKIELDIYHYDNPEPPPLPPGEKINGSDPEGYDERASASPKSAPSEATDEAKE